jgi:branched-chain amino acid transport system substrate-binding protein
MQSYFAKRLVAVSGAVAFALAAGYGTGAKAQSDTIVLGAAVSQTGKYATNGKHTANGYDLAVERINEMGGVKVGDKSYQLSIKYYDDESDAARAAELTERLVDQDGIDFILGPYGSPITAAMAPITEKHKVPMVEGNGASRGIFSKGYRYVFAVLSTSDQYLSSAVDLAAEKAQAEGKDPASLKLALAMGDDNFSQDVRAGILEAAEKHKMQVVIDDKLPDAFTDMSATLTKVKAVQPDVLLISGHEKGALTASRQVAEMRVYVPMLAMTHCDSADIAGEIGAGAEYTLCAAQWAPSLTYSGKWMGSAQEYTKDFTEKFGYEPPYQSAESTAAVLTFADAFERAGVLDTEKVRDAIAATDLETFYGRIDFDDTGKNIAKPMVLFQVLNGKYEVVAPTKWATSKAVYPVPTWDERGS